MKRSIKVLPIVLSALLASCSSYNTQGKFIGQRETASKFEGGEVGNPLGREQLSAFGGISPIATNIVGLECKTALRDQDNVFDLSFRHEPLAGIVEANSIEGTVAKKLTIITDVEKDETLIISQNVGDNSGYAQAIRFKTRDIFESSKPFKAQYSSGAKNDLAANRVKAKPVLCNVANGFLK